jgi:AcrR family transcriptional regulator
MSSTERREQLLDAAVELAAGGDLSALSVRDIAAHAGISEGLLFHYFPTKDALLLATVQRAADTMLSALEDVGQADPLLGLTTGLAAYLDHVQADPTGWRALLAARTGPLAEACAVVEARGREITLELLGAPEPSLALGAAVDGWSALERQVCLDWLEHPSLSRAAVEDLLLSSFLGALEAAARHDAQAREVLERLRPS